MSEPKRIVEYSMHSINDYGHVQVKLAEILKNRAITRNRLATLTGLKYSVIDRYYKNERVAMVDLDFLAKVCYVLDCKVEDLIEYQPPIENQNEQTAPQS